MTQTPEYVEHQLIKSIAQDPSLGELEVDISVAGRTIQLSGRIASERHRLDLTRLVGESFPDFEVVDETQVVEIPPPPEDPG